MSWLDKLNKVGQVAGVVVPILAPQAAGVAGIANIAVGLITAAVKDGKISKDEVAQINALLIPYGLAVVYLEKPDA